MKKLFNGYLVEPITKHNKYIFDLQEDKPDGKKAKQLKFTINDDDLTDINKIFAVNVDKFKEVTVGGISQGSKGGDVFNYKSCDYVVVDLHSNNEIKLFLFELGKHDTPDLNQKFNATLRLFQYLISLYYQKLHIVSTNKPCPDNIILKFICIHYAKPVHSNRQIIQKMSRNLYAPDSNNLCYKSVRDSCWYKDAENNLTILESIKINLLHKK